MKEELERLRNDLLEKGSITVALSGGVDSIFLAAFSHEVLGNQARAVTADAPNFARDEIEYAKAFCREWGIEHQIVTVDLMDEIRENHMDRCFRCKRKLFTKLLEGAEHLADGTNLDDMDDFRPGIKALTELGIWSPLRDAGIGKSIIREELEKRRIAIYDKPAYACLATRVPFGEEITEKKLRAIFRVEEGIRELGISQVRARHHGDICRIEMLPDKWDVSQFHEIHRIGKEAGFEYITLDLLGYQMGRMNKE